MNTLFDKIWDKHVVQQINDGPTQLYIDRLYCHEVTSPQAFEGMRARGLKCFRPHQIFCMPDHNTPTHDQDKPIKDPVSKKQVDMLEKNAADFGLTHYGMLSKDNGIIHVVGPEKGLSLPGMTIVCGDSHTSTHGAMGAVAFGIGTSEVEMVMASQCILQQKPKSMRININGTLGKGVTAKDVALYLMAQLTTSGATVRSISITDIPEGDSFVRIVLDDEESHSFGQYLAFRHAALSYVINHLGSYYGWEVASHSIRPEVTKPLVFEMEPAFQPMTMNLTMMSNYEFEEACVALKNESFDNTRLTLAKQIVSTNPLSAAQVTEICKLFSFESNRLDFAKFAYPYCVDKNKYFLVNAAFSYDSSKRDLDAFIQKQ